MLLFRIQLNSVTCTINSMDTFWSERCLCVLEVNITVCVLRYFTERHDGYQVDWAVFSCHWRCALFCALIQLVLLIQTIWRYILSQGRTVAHWTLAHQGTHLLTSELKEMKINKTHLTRSENFIKVLMRVHIDWWVSATKAIDHPNKYTDFIMLMLGIP